MRRRRSPRSRPQSARFRSGVRGPSRPVRNRSFVARLGRGAAPGRATVCDDEQFDVIATILNPRSLLQFLPTPSGQSALAARAAPLVLLSAAPGTRPVATDGSASLAWA